MPSNGDGPRCWLPRPAQKSRGDFFVAGEMPSDGRRTARRGAAAPQRRRPKVLVATSHAEAARGILRRQRDAKPRQRSNVLAAALRAEATRGVLCRRRDGKRQPTAEEIFGRAPPHVLGDSSSLGRLPSNGDGRRYWPPHPTHKPHGEFSPSLGMLPSDGDSRRYLLPLPARKPRGDFLVVG